MLLKILSFVLFIAAAISLVSFFLAVGSVIIDPFRDAFNPFDFTLFGAAIWGFMEAISTPLIMGMLSLIGFHLSRATRSDRR